MTIASTTSKNTYTGTGSAAVYPFTFYVLNQTHLLVTKTDTNGGSTTLTLGTDYTVTGVGQQTGGSITLTAGNLLSGYRLTVRRVVPLLQGTDLRNTVGYYADTHESVFDYLTMAMQQLQDQFNRSLVVGETDSIPGPLPSASARANLALYFDSLGNPTVAGSASSIPPVSITLVVDTVAQLKSLSPPVVAQTYLVRGYAAAGDGGGGTYRWLAGDSTTDNGGTVLQANAGGAGRWFRVGSNDLDVLCFGAKGDGVTDDTAAVLAALTYVAANGITLHFSRPLTFLCGAMVINPTASFAIEGVPGATLKGKNGTATSVLTVDGLTQTLSFRMLGMGMDNSLCTFIGAGASGTCLSIKNLLRYHIISSSFRATSDYRNNYGDSGITINQCLGGVVDGCYFQGQPDQGVYVTGGPSTGSTDDYLNDTVISCTFDTCAGTAAIKRQGRRFIFSNNHVVSCRTGVSNSEAVSGTEIDPGREMIVVNNHFKKMGSRCLWSKVGNGNIFANNTIIDWGRDPSGTVDASFPQAVILAGANNSIVTGNIIRLEEWADPGTLVGIYVTSLAIVSGTYQSLRNIIDGNMIKGCTFGIQEAGSASLNQGDNYFDTVTTPITYAGSSLSRYGMSDQTGIRRGYFSEIGIGRSDPTDGTKAGLGVTSTGEMRGTVDSNNVQRLNRLTTAGTVALFQQDGTTQGSIQTLGTSGTDFAIFDGGPRLKSFAKASLPSAVTYVRCMIWVTDDIGGSTPAFSDGTNWRRVADRNIIS